MSTKKKLADTETKTLYDKYVLLPISSVSLYSTQAFARNKYWSSLGIDDSKGRLADAYEGLPANTVNNYKHYSSTFSPVLSEIVYRWFAPKNSVVIDPFSGGMSRGSVAARLGHKYYGFEIRKEQCDSNYYLYNSFKKEGDVNPVWVCGDSNFAIGDFLGEFNVRPNFFFTCPPYWNLEKYSDLEGDISNIGSYKGFLSKYKEILKVSLSALSEGDYAAIVVGDIRDEFTGYMLNFDSTTIEYFKEFGFELTNRISVANNPGSASLRAEKYMRYKKVVKTHQDLLIFQKPYSLETISKMRLTKTDEEIAAELNMAIRQVHHYSRKEGKRLYGKQSALNAQIPPSVF